MAGTCTACQGDPVHRSANGSINQNAPISCRQTKPKQRGSYADLRVRRLQDVHFTAILSGYLQDHTRFTTIQTRYSDKRKNDEWFIQLFRYASHTPPTLTETLDIPLTYQEIDQLDDINSFLSRLHKQYSFSLNHHSIWRFIIWTSPKTGFYSSHPHSKSHSVQMTFFSSHPFHEIIKTSKR